MLSVSSALLSTLLVSSFRFVLLLLFLRCDSTDSLTMSSASISDGPRFRVRTVTAFVNLAISDFGGGDGTIGDAAVLTEKVERCATLVSTMEKKVTDLGYEIQTVRIATNPFGEWLRKDSIDHQLRILDGLLEKHGIEFCSLGPATCIDDILPCCLSIVASSPRFSCSAIVDSVEAASTTAQCIVQISKLGEASADAPVFLKGGIGNFRFCGACSCKPFIPFFPAAKSAGEPSDGSIRFAMGLENGSLAQKLLAASVSIGNIPTIFRDGMEEALAPLQTICEETVKELPYCEFVGVDTSLNPSLDDGGSVAEAVEKLEEVRGPFGGPGTLAAAAAITTALQSLPTSCGYSGLMLPVCEDQRLAELSPQLRISNLLSISSVCGVGVDTVPVPGNVEEADLASLLLDVAGLAKRWDKSLSCRVFPVPGKVAGERTVFDSPYLCNSDVFDLS